MNKALLVISISAAVLFAVGFWQVTQTSLTVPRSNLSELRSQEIFATWLTGSKVTYLSSAEYLYRRQVFVGNYEFIQRSNENSANTYKLGLNQFAALTAEEFKSQYLGLKRSTRAKSYGVFQAGKAPAAWDWTEHGAVTPVKNQGSCGSCWAFSTTGTLEGAWAIKSKKLELLSEQQLVDCDTLHDMGCGGGAMDYAFAYLEKNGIETEASYPYQGKNGKCVHKESNSLKGFKLSGFFDVPEKNEQALKMAAAKQPVGVGISARPVQFYLNGIYNNMGCGAQLDHGVLLVGYGSENGLDYWKVKNSWGGGWGEKGFIRFAKHDTSGDVGICGITEMASYPTLG